MLFTDVHFNYLIRNSRFLILFLNHFVNPRHGNIGKQGIGRFFFV